MRPSKTGFLFVLVGRHSPCARHFASCSRPPARPASSSPH